MILRLTVMVVVVDRVVTEVVTKTAVVAVVDRVVIVTIMAMMGQGGVVVEVKTTTTDRGLTTTIGTEVPMI